MFARYPSPSHGAASAPGCDAKEGAAAAGRGSVHAEDSPHPLALRWTARPARRHPARAAAVLFAPGLVAWVALAAFGSPVMAVVGSAALLGALAEGLFPIHYRLSASGVEARCAWQVRAMSWSAVRSAWTGADGVYLCPFLRPSRFLRTRGVVLRFEDGNHAVVLDAVRRYWDGERRAEAAPGGAS